MKVKFLRNYKKNRIGDEIVLTVDEKEKKYLVSTGTIVIVEDDEIEEEETEEIPAVKVDEKAGKNGKKGNNK